MSDLRWGVDVLVRAETVRVLGKLDETGRAIYRQTVAGYAGRFVTHNFRKAVDWPGVGISTDVEGASSQRFEVAPALTQRPFVRLRRLEYDRPELGIVIGQTWREEGQVIPGYDSGAGEAEPAYLSGPGRKITLYEIALKPNTGGKARIVLAHAFDLSLLPARASA